MKIFDSVGREHEEFKLRLEKDKEIDLANININGTIAEHQAKVLGEALKNTKVDIVGGDTDFYDRIVSAVTRGKSVDRLLGNSSALTDVRKHSSTVIRSSSAHNCATGSTNSGSLLKM